MPALEGQTPTLRAREITDVGHGVLRPDAVIVDIADSLEVHETVAAATAAPVASMIPAGNKSLAHMTRVEQAFAMDAKVFIGHLWVGQQQVCTALLVLDAETHIWSIFSEHAVTFPWRVEQQQQSPQASLFPVCASSAHECANAGSIPRGQAYKPVRLCDSPHGIIAFEVSAQMREEGEQPSASSRSDKEDLLVMLAQVHDAFSPVGGRPDVMAYSENKLASFLSLCDGDHAYSAASPKTIPVTDVWSTQFKCGNTIPIDGKASGRSMHILTATHTTEVRLFQRGLLFRDHHLHRLFRLRTRDASTTATSSASSSSSVARLPLTSTSRRMDTHDNASSSSDAGVATCSICLEAIGGKEDGNDGKADDKPETERKEVEEEEEKIDVGGGGGDGDGGAPISACVAHPVHQACLRTYVEHQVDERRVKDIKCPGLRCQTVLPNEVTRQVLTIPYQVRMDRFRTLDTDSDARACPKCHHVQTHNPFDGNSMTCGACATVYCREHELAHPATETCRAFESRMGRHTEVDRAFAQHTSIACPGRGCTARITKSSGCNAMKCSQCSSSFCYLCGGFSFYGRHFRDRMLFGCVGLQMVQGAPNSRRRWWRSVLRVLVSPWLYLISGLALLALAFVAVGLFLAFSCLWLGMMCGILLAWLTTIVGLSPVWCMTCCVGSSSRHSRGLQDACMWGPTLMLEWWRFNPCRIKTN